MLTFKISQKITFLAIPGKDPIAGDKLVYSQRTGNILRLSENYVALLRQNQFLDMPAQLIQILVRNELIVPAIEDEATAVLSRQAAYQQDNQGYDFLQLAQLPDHDLLDLARKSKLI